MIFDLRLLQVCTEEHISGDVANGHWSTTSAFIKLDTDHLCLRQTCDEEHVGDMAHPSEYEPLQLLLVHLDELPDRPL